MVSRLIRTYDDLVSVLRERAAELKPSRVTIDAVGRALGRVSLGPMLKTLGIALIAVEDAAALALVKDQLVPRNETYAANAERPRRKRRRRVGCR